MKSRIEALCAMEKSVSELALAGVSVDDVEAALHVLTLVEEPRLVLVYPFIEQVDACAGELRKLVAQKNREWWQKAKNLKISLPELTKRRRLEERLARLWKKERPLALKP